MSLKYKGYLGSSEISKEDKCLYGKILFIDDLITYQANTYPELEREFAAAVDDYLETCQEVGKEPQKPFSGTFNVRIGPERHQRLAAIVAQDKSLKSINDAIKAAIDQFLEPPPERTQYHYHLHNHSRVGEVFARTSVVVPLSQQDKYVFEKTSKWTDFN